ncbi:MAG TPA: DUF222 domain-containing protein [Thermoanaerobaculia bacterium]|nr:DUF222 domain-containing protein [Thermoanaerobaculia bacterium]
MWRSWCACGGGSTASRSASATSAGAPAATCAPTRTRTAWSSCAGGSSRRRARRCCGRGPEQKRADAMGLVAESALAAGLDPGSRGDRFLVVVHVDGEVLAADGPAQRPAPTPDGENPCECRGGPPCPPVWLSRDIPDVSAETSRRLACEASRVTVRHDREGRVLDVGRKTRAIPPAMRRALSVRDGGCRFPGCGLKLCDAHHVEHWADGGATRLDNLLLLCRRTSGRRARAAPSGEGTPTA